MNYLSLWLATLLSAGSAPDEPPSPDGVETPSYEPRGLLVFSLDGKTPAETKSRALAAAQVKVLPAPAAPPLVGTVAPDGRVVLHHGKAKGKPAGKPE